MLSLLKNTQGAQPNHALSARSQSRDEARRVHVAVTLTLTLSLTVIILCMDSDEVVDTSDIEEREFDVSEADNPCFHPKKTRLNSLPATELHGRFNDRQEGQLSPRKRVKVEPKFLHNLYCGAQCFSRLLIVISSHS